MEKGTSGRNHSIGTADATRVRMVSATTTLDPSDRVVYVNIANTFTVTLPPVQSCPGAFIYIRAYGTAGGAVTVATPGGGDHPAADIATVFTQDDLTQLKDFKLLMNVGGVQWIELKEQTT